MSLKCFCILMLLFLVFPSSVSANSVIQTQLHSHGPSAEFCFVFEKPILTASRQSYLSSLSVKEGAKKLRLKKQDLSLTPTHLCIQNLKHNRFYEVTFRKMKGVLGRTIKEKIWIPNRKRKLYFESLTHNHSFIRLFENSKNILHSVNVSQAHLTLYRVNDNKAYFSAWQHFITNLISPSESLLFVKEKGDLVFETDLFFNNYPNKTQTLSTPFPLFQNLKKGLYYLAATPKSEQGVSPALFVGKWFLISDLNLTVQGKGEQLFVSAQVKGKAVPDALITLWDEKGETILTGRTNSQGHVLFPKVDIARVYLISAESGNGTDFLPSIAIERLQKKKDFHLYTNKERYKPGEEVFLYLKSSEPVTGHVKLVQPNGSVYAEFEAKDTILIKAPYLNGAGLWSVQWEKEGIGSVETLLEIASDPSIQKMTVKNDWLTVSARYANGKPVAYKNGYVVERCSRAQHPKWSNYFFGVLPHNNCSKRAPHLFVTNEEGKAFIKVQKDAEWHKEYDLFIEGNAQKTQLVTPADFQKLQVGIRPYRKDKVFSENSEAAFDVIALGEFVPRRFYYHIYEEGRRFDWYRKDGIWQYRRLPDHNRIGGGSFSVKRNIKQKIVWPVTTGSYFIEISDESGKALAQLHFEAGKTMISSLLKNEKPQKNVLKNEGSKRAIREQKHDLLLLSGDVLHSSFQIKKSLSLYLPQNPMQWKQSEVQVEHNQTYNCKGVCVASPVPLPFSFQALTSYVSSVPLTTYDISSWLNVVEKLNPVLIQTGVLSKKMWEYFKRYRLLQIMKHQKKDGGFAAHRDLSVSSIRQTTAALRALYLYNKGQYVSEEKRAEQWLKDHLKGPWLDEADTVDRAIALSVMASRQRIDVSSLAYFAQSHETKNIPIVAKAALVRAFMDLGDKTSADKWFKKIPSDWMRNAQAMTFLVDYSDVSFSTKMLMGAESSYVFEAVSLLAEKAGTWKIISGAKKIKKFGLMVVPQSFKNKAERPLYLLQLRKDEFKRGKDLGVKRRFYHTDGTPVQEEEVLVSQKPYVMTLSGRSESTLHFVLPVSSTYEFKLVAVKRPSLLYSLFPWLDKQAAAPTDIYQTDEGVALSVPAGIAWHAVVIMTPKYAGAFSVPDFYVIKDGKHKPVLQKKVRFKIF